LLTYGIGLTDPVKTKAGSYRKLSREDYDIEGFKKKIQRRRPRAVCFNGKTAAKRYLGKKGVEYGFQQEKIGNTLLFVAPSTSPSAKRWWDIRWWKELSEFLSKVRK